MSFNINKSSLYLKLDKLKGIFPILYSFFNKNNSLDKILMEEQIDIVSSIGSHGIACLGLATEVQKLSFKEKKIIIEMIAKKLNGIIPFAVTIQGNSLKEQIDLINIASANQANWIILQPYLKTKKISENDCLNYYKKLIPYVKDSFVGIQNAFEYLGVGISTKNIINLYNLYPNFRVIKGESPSYLIRNEIKQYPKDLYVFNGRGGLEIVDNLSLGCKGIVPALDCADKFIKIYKYLKKNEKQKANKEYEKILPSIVFIMQSIDTLVCYGKRVFAYRMGIKNVYDRKLKITPDDYGIKKTKEIAKNLGFFEF